ncbi:MAG: hypothetical protein ATN32_02680 [Candidatus Epulonipiscium fishelsonii]|nr:MAG: hypothetical protein ATN32_02680 [Epulopiscium sp. AS2M-Bin002]
MKLFSKLVINTLILSIISSPALAVATKTTVQTPILNTAEEYADFLIDNRGVRSIQYALIKDGKFIISGASGINSLEQNTLVNTEDIYAIGSISKMFTTAMILNLIEDGKLELDEPVYKYIPDFVMEDDRYKDITVRMLLNHSSGLIEGNFPDAILVENNDSRYHDNLLKSLKTARLNADPGEFSVYSNTGFGLAEILIERVSGLPYTEYLYKYITQPLGLENTKTPKDDFNMMQIARSGAPSTIEEFYQGEKILDFPIEIANGIGAAGIFSTAEDICKFAEIFLNEGILKQDSINLTTSAEYLNGIWPDGGKNSVEYGLGWDSVALQPFDEAGIKVLFKGGDLSLSHASLLAVPEYDMAVAVLSVGGSSTLDMFMGAQMLIDELVKDGKMQPPKIPKIIPLMEPIKVPINFSKYNGIYSNIMDSIKIDVKGDRVELSKPENPDFATQTFIYQGNGIFKADKSNTLTLQFVDEDNGNTYINFKSIMKGLDPFNFAIKSNQYQYQQIKPNPLPEPIEKVWVQRLGKIYYPLAFHYDVIANTQGIPSIVLPNEILPAGYIFGLKIMDENNLESTIQIPMLGRGAIDLEFYDKDGIEYLKTNANTYIEEKGIKDLLDGTYIIGDDGYCQYFKSSENDKNVQVNINGPGTYSIYNPNQICIYSSVLEPEKIVELTPGSIILISGEPGTIFDIIKNVK